MHKIYHQNIPSNGNKKNVNITGEETSDSERLATKGAKQAHGINEGLHGTKFGQNK